MTNTEDIVISSVGVTFFGQHSYISCFKKMLLILVLPFALAQYALLRDLSFVYVNANPALRELKHQMNIPNNDCKDLFNLVNAGVNQSPFIDLTNTFMYIGQTGKTQTACLSTILKTVWKKKINILQFWQLDPTSPATVKEFKDNVISQISELLKKSVFHQKNAKFDMVVQLLSLNDFVELLYTHGYSPVTRQELLDKYLYESGRPLKVEEKSLAILEVAKYQLDIGMILKIYDSMNALEISKYTDFLQIQTFADVTQAPSMFVQLVALSNSKKKETGQLLLNLLTFLDVVPTENRDMTFVVTQFVLQYKFQSYDHVLEQMLINVVRQLSANVYPYKFRDVVEFYLETVKRSKSLMEVRYLYHKSPDYIKATCQLASYGIVFNQQGWDDYQRSVKQRIINSQLHVNAAKTLTEMHNTGSSSQGTDKNDQV